MATTHRDLRRASQEGSFRSDLYYRLRVVHLRIPPLRERRSDIPRLIDACLTRFASRAGRSKPIVAPRVLAAYAEHDWPGNVRELMHLVEAEASLLAPNETVIHRTPTLQGLLATCAPAPSSRQAPVSEAPPPSAAMGPPSAPSPWPAERPPDSLSAGSAPVTRMEEVERQAYVEALERFEGNVSKAAQALGVSRGTFYNKMRRHGIEARSQVRQSTPPKGS
jgi:DNA-binding NtrC family response regulator